MGLLSKDKSEAENLIYTHDASRLEQREMEKIFARMFSTDEGKKALSYLQMITFHRALGPNSSDVELRHLEGQRAMVATILRLIDRGRQG